jgi:PAS domain S-box-containing protein
VWSFLILGLALSTLPLASFGASAPEYLITKWETDDGLPENSATAMVQTPDRYLWFGSFAGLVRFDGVKFTVFDRANTPELPHNGIVNLHLDQAGSMWVSTLEGLARLKDGVWKRFGDAEGWTGNYARTFAEGGGRLFATSFNGKVFELTDERWTQLPAPAWADGNGFFGEVEDGTLYVVSPSHISRWNGRTWEEVAAPFLDGQSDLCIGPARGGGMWISQTKRLWRLRAGKVEKDYTLSRGAGAVWSLTEDRDGIVWLASYNMGLTRVDPGVSEDRFSTTNGLTYNSLRFVFQDREGNHWVGSSGGGLMRFKPRTFHTFGLMDGLPERLVKSVSVGASGQVLVGTYGGGAAELVPDRGWERIPVRKVVWDGFSAYAQSVLLDRAGNLWLGFYGQGLFRRTGPDLATGRRPDFEDRDVHALFQDSRGRMWVGGEKTAVTQNGEVFEPVGGPFGAGGDAARYFVENPADGSIWIAGTKNRIYRKADGEPVAVETTGAILESQINAMVFDRDGNLWLATSGQGLGRLKGGRLHFIPPSTVLPATLFGCLLEDDSGNLWAGSNRGVWRIERESLLEVADGRSSRLRCQGFTINDGLASAECTIGFQPSGARDASGRLWFATLKGVARVDPNRIQIETEAPLSRIESAAYLDPEGRRHRLRLQDNAGLRVPAGNTQIEVDYTAPTFSDPARVWFSRRLLKGDEVLEAVETTSRCATASLLPPGDYTLEIRAANHHGVLATAPTLVHFSVQPFFWQTVWFRTTVWGVILAGVGGAAWSTQLRKVRTQQRQLVQLQQESALAEERARLAAVVSRSESALRALMDALPNPAFLLEKDGTFVAVNEALARSFGRRREELIGRVGYELLSPELAAERRKAIERVISTGTDISFEDSNRGRRYMNYLAPVRDMDGGVSRVAVFALDITDRKEMERRLLESKKLEAIGQLAGGVAHDFNNVLAAIFGNLSLAMADVGEGHVAMESLEEIRKASQRAKSLVQQILAFGRRQPQERRIISLQPVIEEAAGLLRATLPPRITLECGCDADSPAVLADPTQMLQVVLNLCTNARQALEEQPGRLEVRLSGVTLDTDAVSKLSGLQPGRFACLSVSDTGKGIDAATLERIFEPFFTTKPLGQGTGLGLSVVHGVVRSHDGAISVSSTPGQGTCFQLYFPAQAGDVTAAPEAAVASRPGHGQRILFLDDEEPMVFLAQRMLTRLGYQVTGYTRPAEALQAFRANPDQFDLVVTDMNMPGLSGLHVADELLKCKTDAVVVLSSGHVTDELKEQARRVGVRHVLYKPNTVEEFSDSIHRLISDPSVSI